MRYVALLRGINVGGNNKIAMPELAKTVKNLGYTNVTTYINSGNVFFDSDDEALACSGKLHQIIKKDFALDIPVLVRSRKQIEATVKALPGDWQNNVETKCDVLFLWDQVDTPAVTNGLKLIDSIDEVIYTPGALLWRVNRARYSRSGMSKLVGTPLYKQITVRNCNTLRKIAERL